MNAYVFVGPTVTVADAARELQAHYLPPASEGDVYRAALQSPKAIGIIDGYFQSVPAVRHKEILWAMSRGIHVFGSSSMGALRAAELAAFGMEGIGQVFEWYQAGTLEDDDEVAIAHGPAQTGFFVASEAMVNIRPTLQRANSAGVISAGLRLSMENIAKSLFYADRTYSLILRCALQQGAPEDEVSALRDWLRNGRVDQKRDDALSMLRTMRERLARGLEPKKVIYTFEHTTMWDAVRKGGEVRRGEGE